MSKTKIKSFNLQETLIVLAIIGILLLIAIPNLMPLITRAKSVEAQIQLKAIYNAERQYYYTHSKYTGEFPAIDFEVPRTVDNDGPANYSYEITEFSQTNFKAVATAVTDFNGNGVYNVWEIDQSGIPKQIVAD